MEKLRTCLTRLVLSQLLTLALYVIVIQYIQLNDANVTPQNVTDDITDDVTNNNINSVVLRKKPLKRDRSESVTVESRGATKSVVGSLQVVTMRPRINRKQRTGYQNITPTLSGINLTQSEAPSPPSPGLSLAPDLAQSHVNLTSIAIGLAITAHKIRSINWLDIETCGIQFLSGFLVSFCPTASPQYDYRFYLAFDQDDKLFTDEKFRDQFSRMFYDHVTSMSSGCPMSSRYVIHFVQCTHTGNPAWAQNDAMIAGYMDNADYYYRINDDTALLSPGWTEHFIAVLAQYLPPNVGVVGPNHRGGNRIILTYDFVHRTHIEVFGAYYPRCYPSWYADNWMTNVYLPGRMTKAMNVTLRHTMNLGKRYTAARVSEAKRQEEIRNGQNVLRRYLQSVEKVVNRTKVISMVIWNNETDSLWGVIRNAQIRHVIYPDWLLRVYVINDVTDTSQLINMTSNRRTGFIDLQSTLDKLQTLGVDVVLVDGSGLPKEIPKSVWNLLAVDDHNATYVLLRAPYMRLSEREAAAVDSWIQQSDITMATHCMRDHPRHANMSLMPALWGLNTVAARKILDNQSLRSVINEIAVKHRSDSEDGSSVTESAVYDKLWDIFRNNTLCHDSVSCTKWTNSRPFPVRREKKDFVGKLYTAFMPVWRDRTPVFSTHASCISPP